MSRDIVIPEGDALDAHGIDDELDADLREAGRLLQKRIAPSTRATYLRCWGQFTTWCCERGVASLPATPDTIAAWLGRLSRKDCAPSTLRLHVAAIRLMHIEEARRSGRWSTDGLAGLPTSHPAVVGILQGAAREPADAAASTGRRRGPVRALKLTDDDGGSANGPLRRLVHHLPPTVAGWRDRALLLLGWAGALRASEVVSLNLGDLEPDAEGLIVRLRVSKGDRTGAGAMVAVPRATDPTLCPVGAWLAWRGLLARHIGDGVADAAPAFPRLTRAGLPLAGSRLTGHAVAIILRQRLKAAGIDPSGFSGHSLRRGVLTSARDRDLVDLQRHARHKDVRTTSRYIEAGELFKRNPVKGLL